VTFDANALPNLARHVNSAINPPNPWDRRWPSPLHRDLDQIGRRNRHDIACLNFFALQSCDEYPFASTWEGGWGASVADVPRDENSLQGRVLSAFYARNRIGQDDALDVQVVGVG
jgi:hypothetical protein